MVAIQKQSTVQGKTTLGILAQFDKPDELVTAADELRAQGFERLEAFSPFPLHGIDDVLGVPQTRLPWLVLGAGTVGGVSALVFQWWTNAVDYAYITSGKPLFSLPANIPVAFEAAILFAAFAAFFGMLALNGLPKLANPLLRNPRFRAATNNGFFILVDAKDERFDRRNVSEVMSRVGALHLTTITEEHATRGIPKAFVMTCAVIGSLALVPPFVIASARSKTSDKPRLHNFFDMDFQPKFKSQTSTPLFADGRSMRPRVTGTVPRGQLNEDTKLYSGIDSTRPIALPRSATTADIDSPSSMAAEPNWVDTIPLSITGQMMDRGRERFNIHCAVCHGRSGEGNGLASLRALELEQGTWVPPTSIHAEHVRQQPDGELFNTITNGVRKMPGYGHQISAADRWAIVLYLRALQRSQNATIDDVPDDVRLTLRELN